VDKKIFLLLILSFNLLFAEGEETDIKGIVMTGERKEVLFDGRAKVKGVQISHLEVPGDEQALRKIVEPFIGQTLSKQTAIEVKQKILLYYLSQKKPLTGVELPEQKTKGNVIQVLVTQQRFGKPLYKGETWYSNDQLNKYLGIGPGQDIAEDTLQNNMSWLNRNPFQYTQAKYVQSDEPGVVDLEVSSKKRRALRFYGRAENTGTETTGYGRFATGFTWGNAMWRGDLLSFEYACSNEFSRFQSYTGNYTSFMPWKHIVMLYANYATVKPSDTNANIDAKSFQTYLHYTIPIKPLYTPFKQEVILGVEYKYTNSNIVSLQGGVPVVQLPDSPPTTKQLNVSQLYANYTMYDVVGNHNLSFSLDLYGSPAAFLAHQSNSEFNALRTHSKNKYFYSYLTFSEIYTVPNVMSIAFLLRGQISNNTLPPTELFCMGGYNTVRGYHECEYSSDNGLIANLELRTKPMQLSKHLKDKLILLAFCDYAFGNNWYIPKRPNNAPTPPRTQHLLGVGPGLRYAINPYLQARVDYGFKLDHLFISNKPEEVLRLGFGQFHLGLLVSF